MYMWYLHVIHFLKFACEFTNVGLLTCVCVCVCVCVRVCARVGVYIHTRACVFVYAAKMLVILRGNTAMIGISHNCEVILQIYIRRSLSSVARCEPPYQRFCDNARTCIKAKRIVNPHSTRR